MAQKPINEIKKSRDVYFRRRAKAQSLSPVTDLNAEIRQKVKTSKGTKERIDIQKNRIRLLEKDNKKIRDKKRALEQQLPFQDDKGKKKIETELKKPDYKTISIARAKNKLKRLQGKDFNFYVDDGFKIYKVNTKTIKSAWKRGEDATLLILKKMGSHSEQALKYWNERIKKEKTTATRAEMKKYRRIRDGIQKKLNHTIQQNIAAVETGNMSELDEINEDDEKAYSLLFKVIGEDIDRIGI